MFSDWQAQQKAQKDAERKAKREAEAALQGYRRSGLSEEETKLAALREQERLQKLSAEQQLHGYRSQLSEEEAKLLAQRQEELRRKQELEEQLRTNGVVSAQDANARHTSFTITKDSGVVSALAATYSSPSAPPRPESASVAMAMHEAPVQPDFSSAAVVPDGLVDVDVAAATAAFDAAVITSEPGRGPSSDTNAMASQMAPSPAAESAPIAPEPLPSFGMAPAPAAESAPNAPEPLPSFDMAPAPAAESTPIAPEPLLPLPAIPTDPTVIHSSIVFMFGILTAEDITIYPPDYQSEFVSGYLKKADELIKSVIGTSESFAPIMSNLDYPIATAIEKDHSRTDVSRTLVTVKIDYAAPSGKTCREFQAQVIERVRVAIADGSFTKGGATSISR